MDRSNYCFFPNLDHGSGLLYTGQLFFFSQFELRVNYYTQDDFEKSIFFFNFELRVYYYAQDEFYRTNFQKLKLFYSIWSMGSKALLSTWCTSKLTNQVYFVYTRLKALEKPCHNIWSIKFKIKCALKKTLTSLLIEKVSKNEWLKHCH